MSIPLLIVDDSRTSRKMIIKSLPPEWDVVISEASNGLEALEAYRAGKGEVMFLDLTMPELDGFGVLEALKREGFKAFVFVISADIQPQSIQRVKSLGAMAFVKKPITAEKMSDTLREFGLI